MERISNSQLEILINFGIKKLDISRTMSALQELKERREIEQSGRPGELPADLQDVYNLLHLTEEQFEVLDNFLEKSLTAIENASKYEKVIVDMADWIRGTAEVGEYCDECQYFDGENESCAGMAPVECRANIIEYYKKRAGLKCTKTLQTE